MNRTKYMIGATVVCVSVDVDDVAYIDGKPGITVFYKKIDDDAYAEGGVFGWSFNNFRTTITGLDAETQYTMYTRVKHVSGSFEDSAHLTFRTDKYGTTSYVIGQPVVDYRGDYSDKVREYAERAVGMMNDIGLQYGSINFNYKYSVGTAEANYHKYVNFGYNACATYPWEYFANTVVHELRHYFGDADYNQHNGSGIIYNRSIRFADGQCKTGLLKKLYTRLGDCWWYSIDNVFKYKAGSDIAFLNLNGDHESQIRGADYEDYFSLRANNLEKVWVVESQDECDLKETLYQEVPTMLYAMDAEDHRIAVYSTMENLSAVLNSITELYSTHKTSEYVKKIYYGSGITSLDGLRMPGNATEWGSYNTFTSLPADFFYGQKYMMEFIGWNGLTKIGNTCFENSRFETIDIPATVTSIGARAFASMTNLRKLIFRSTQPPSVSYQQTFWSGFNATIYVPDDSMDLYTVRYRAVEDKIHPLSEIEP